jgi:hypothetical protein
LNSILDAIFPDALLGKRYSTDSKDVQERSDMFRNMWEEWKHTNITLPADLNKANTYGSARFLDASADKKVKTFAKTHKLKEFWEFQVRGNEVRFADEDMALLFRLTI